jgi:transketolase N-terminal domain/subunit
MVSIGALIPLASLVSQMFIVETPRWLLEKGHAKRAVDALRRTAHYTDAQLDRQVREIEATLAEEKASGQNVLRELFCPTRALLHAMLVGFGMAFFQQGNGSEAVVYFTPTVLRSAGIEDVDTLYGCTAAVGACKVGWGHG